VDIETGKTYMADRLRNDSRVIESAHDQNTKTTFFKVIDASSTDHLPIIDVNVNVNVHWECTTSKENNINPKKLPKKFQANKWTGCLAGKEWEDLV
jgi:hypothetical protein